MTDLARRTLLEAAGASMLVAAAAGYLGDSEETDDEQPDAIEPGETILLEAYIDGWEVVEPSELEGEQNPTLVLEEDEEYEIAWQQGDGTNHDLVLWDEDEEVVEDYETPPTQEPDPDGEQLIEFTATDELAYYRCTPHLNMQGEIDVE